VRKKQRDKEKRETWSWNARERNDESWKRHDDESETAWNQ